MARTIEEIIAERKAKSKTAFNDSKSRISEEEKKRDLVNLGRDQQDLALRTEQMNSFAVDDVSDYHRRDALQNEISRLEKQNTSQEKKLTTRSIVDRVVDEDVRGTGFVDTAKSNLGLGQLQQDNSLAWNRYINDPSLDNKRAAESLDAAMEYYQMKQKESLYTEDAEGKQQQRGNWISKDLAQYVPQLLDQIQAQVPAQLGAMAIGAATGGAGYAQAAQLLGGLAAGKQSFDVMRGASYKGLKELGVSEETALRISRNEALISAMIESAETIFSFSSLGFSDLLKSIGSFGVKKVAQGLAREGMEQAAESSLKKLLSVLKGYGINILTEAGEEAAQEGVAILAEKTAMRNDGLERTATAQEDWQRIAESAAGGAKIAAMMGAPAVAATQIGNRVVQRRSAERIAQNERAIKTAVSADEAKSVGIQAKKQAIVEASTGEIADVFRALGDEGSKAYRDAVISNPKDEEGIRSRMAVAYSTGLSSNKSFDDAKSLLGDGNENELRAFYEAAQKDRVTIEDSTVKTWSEAQSKIRSQRAEFLKTAEAGLLQDTYAEKLNPSVRKSLDLIAKQLGNRIVIAPRVGSDLEGRAVVDLDIVEGFADQNGFYDPNTKTIFLNADLDKKTFKTTVHEVTHAIQKQNSKGYQEFKDIVVKAIIDTQGENAFQRYSDWAMSNYNVELSVEQAQDEMVANEIARAFDDPKKFIEKYNGSVTIGRKIVEAIRKTLRKIKNTIATWNGTDAEKAEFIRYQEAMEQAQTKWMEALKGASVQKEPVQSEVATDAGDVSVLDDEPRFSFRGITEDGIEVYETSEEIKELPYRERMRIFLNLMKNEYRGRTAKFTVRNQVYYAKFDTDDIKKNIFGDKKSSRGGRIAKINTGADGSIFELVENAQYDRSGYDKGKDIKAHVGVAGWDYFLKQVQIDDVLFDLLANVRKKPDGEFVYSIQLNEHKKTAAPSRQYRKGKAEAIKNRSVRLATTVSTNSINENNSEVNQQFSLRKDDDYYNQVNSKEEIIRLIGTKYYDRINHPAFKLAKGAISDLVDTQMTLSESIEMDKDTDKPFRKQGTTNFTGQGKLIGKRFIDELVDTGRVNLTGITFQDTRELAMIAQIYRDPRFETFRIIYVRGNQIVGQKTISSRLPSVSRVTFVDDWAEVARDMKNMKDRLKADGYYILHNHPSGDPEPSNEDLSVTVSYAERAPGFINHIIINSGKYTEIGVDTTKKHRWHSMKDLPVGNDKLLKGLHVKEFIREGISRKDFLNPQKIATAAKLTQLNKDQSVAFYIGAKGELSALMEIEDSFLLGALDEVKIVSVSNFFKNRMREYGAVYAVVVVQNKKESRLFKRAMAKLIMDGSLIDGITIKENEPYFSYAEQNGTSGISWQMPLSDNVYKERTPKPKPNTQFSLRAADKKQLDEEYLEAVQANDLEKAQKMVAEYAHKQGYIQDESYKMWHKAPTNDGFNKSIDDLTDLYPDDLYSSNGARYYGMGEPRDYEAINKLRKVKGKPDAKVWVYRAVPKDVKESEIRNGDWITLTRDYAMEHGKSNIDGPFRVIKQVVLAKHVFTDANSIQEYGYDDGKNYAYQNTKNNRKLFDAVVHDDEGNVIPLSKRFDKKNYDARYSLRGSEVEITDETVGYGSGQYEMIMTAVVDGIKAGFIEYSVYQGKPYIKFINTVESMRRMGVATRLLQELQKEYPNTEIDWGYTTPDGTALKDKVTFTKKNGAYTRAKNEYLKNIERLNELERMFDEEDYSSGDEWNKVYDRQAVLEKKLRELKPSTSWVKYSLRDSEGRELTEAQAEFFKDSKVRDEDGDLLIMYHGTADKAFTIFDIDKANKSSLYGQGFYFTADKHIANEYTNKGTYAYGVVDVKPKGETEWSKDKFEYFVDVLKKHVAYYDSKYNLVHSTKGMSDEQRSAEHEKILKFMKKERKEYSDYSYFRSFLEYDITEYDVGERGLYQENPDFYLTFPGDNGKTIVVAKNALKRLFETDSVSEKIAKYGFEVEIQRPLPGSFKTYLNIKNPLYVDTQVLTDEEIEVLDLVSEANDVQYLYEKNQRWYREQYKKFHPRSLRTLLLKLEYDARDNKSKKIFGFRENLYEKVKSLGYDGMTHTGGWNVGSVEHEVWIAFSPEQIKSVDNKHPTNDADIRFMLRNSDELVKENKLLKKENDLLKKRYELYKKQIKLSRIKPDMEKVEAFGKKFLKLQSSDMDIMDFSKAAYDIFESIYFANKGKGDPAAREYAEILANELAKEVMSFYNEKMSFENEEVKEIRTMLRNIRIIPTDIAKEDLDPIKRKYRRIKWAKPEESSKPNVFDLFTAYEMFAERFPDIFDADEDQPQEMLNRIITASEAVQTITGSSGNDFTDYIPDVAMQILEAYDDVVELEAVLNERQKRIQQIQSERNKAQEALKLAMEEADRQKIRYAKEQVREREIELKQALKEERKRVLAEAKKQGQSEAEEELKVKIQQIEDRAKQIIEKEKLKAEARILREKKRQQERVLEERQKRKNSNNIAIQNFLKSVERTSVRKTIHQRIDKLNKMAFDPTDKAHMPSDMEQAVVDFTRIIRPMAKGTKPTENDLKRLVEIAAYIQGLDNEDNGETHLIDVDLADNLIELSKILKTKTFAFDPKGQKKENSMNLFELQVLNDALAGMSQYVKMRNQLFTDVKNSDIYKTSQAISDELSYETVMENGKLVKKPIDGYSRFESGLLQAPRDMVSTDMLAPLDFAERLGPTFQEVFQKGIRDGMDRKIELLKRAEEYMLDLIGDAKVEEWSGPKAKLIEQFGLRMTVAQWMSLYVTVRQDQAVEHIVYGGVVPTDYVVKGSGPVSLGKVQRGYEPVRLSEAQIRQITEGDMLTEAQKRIALGVSDFFMSEVAEWGNEVSLLMYDYRKFTEENYFPIVSDGNFVSEEIGKTLDRTLRNMGSTKKRIRGAKNPIRMEDIFDVFSNHVDKYSSYNAFVPALSDLQRIYNQQVSQGTVKLAIAKRYGDRMQQYYKKLIVDINGGMRTELEAAPATWLASKYKSAVIGMNLRVIVQQPTSLVRASAMIDPKYLAKGLMGKVDWELVKTYAPIAQWKDWGYFTLDVGRQLRNVFLGKENITDKMMAGVGAADRFAWLRLWRAVEIETTDLRPDLETGSEEFFQHVGARFSEIIDRTQVVDTVLHRTGIMRAGVWSKMITSFMSEPLKSYNLLNTAVRNFKSNRTIENAAKVKRTFAAWAATVAVTGIARALMDMWRDEDEPEEGFFKEFFEKWLNNVKYEPLEMFPYLRDWLSSMQGYSVERLDAQLIEKAWRAFSRLDDGKYTLAARLYNMASVIFEAAGIPASSASREVSDLMRNTLNFFEAYEAQYSVMNMQYDVRNQANAARYIDLLFEAHREGDMNAYNNIMRSLIENGYTASKIDDGMRSRYKKAGNAPPEFQSKTNTSSTAPETSKVTVESLKPAEAIKYLDNYSSVTNELMDRIKKTDIYRTGNDVLRAKIENAVFDYAKSNSLSIASNGRYVEDSSWINNAKQAIEDGIGLPQYIALLEGRKEYGASIGASGVTQEETEDYLDAQRLKREEKAALWAIFYPKSLNPFK